MSTATTSIFRFFKDRFKSGLTISQESGGNSGDRTFVLKYDEQGEVIRFRLVSNGSGIHCHLKIFETKLADSSRFRNLKAEFDSWKRTQTWIASGGERHAGANH